MMNGRLDLDIFVQTLFGLMIGAFVGAKCTHLAPRPLLKAAIVGMPTKWGRHLWGRRDPRDAPGGKVCDNFPHFAPPRIFLGNTRVSKVKYGDTPVTSP